MNKYYYVKPALFFDSTNNGFGDYDGLIEKSNYINKLKINKIIISNPLITYKSNFLEEIVANENKFGDWESFLKMIKHYHELGINIYLEFDLELLNEIVIWWENLNKRLENSEKEIQAKEFYDINKTESFYITSESSEVTIEAKIDRFSKQFLEMLEMFIDDGVNGFLFKNINIKEINKTIQWSDFLKFIYSKMKNINSNIEILAKVQRTEYNQALKYQSIIFDNLLLDENKLSFNKFKKIAKYVISKNVVSNLTYINNKRTINFLLKNYYLNTEIAKLMLAINFLTSENVIINYGDELGLNIFHKLKTPFSVETFLKNFFKKDKNNPIFLWNTEVNAGFSKNDQIFGILDSNYEIMSLKTQRQDPNSVLVFYKKLINFIEQKSYGSLIKEAQINVKTVNNILSIKIKGLDYSINVLSNLTSTRKRIKNINQKQIIFGNYYNNVEDKRLLNSYELIVYIDDVNYRDLFKW